MFSSGPPLCNSLQMFQAHSESGAFPTTPQKKKNNPFWVLDPARLGLIYNFCASALCWVPPARPRVPLTQAYSPRPRLDSSAHCSLLICPAGSPPATDAQTGIRPPCMDLSAMNMLETRRLFWRMCLVIERKCFCVVRALTNHQSWKNTTDSQLFTKVAKDRLTVASAQLKP